MPSQLKNTKNKMVKNNRVDTGDIVRPLLRWAGSKRRMVPKILTLIPRSFGRYVEPFAGSACVFLALQPHQAILGDLNKEVINAYKVLKIEARALHEALSGLPSDKELYYEIRKIDPSSLDTFERAARFMYLNRHCFNGVYRQNQKGEFNVPWGCRTGAIPTLDEFLKFSKALGKARIVNGDFEETANLVEKNDFVYLDPPYRLLGVRNRGEYGYDSFAEDDVARLTATVDKLSRRGAKVLVSYAARGNLRLPGWTKIRVRVARSVAGFLEKRRTVDEVLLTNYRL